MNECIVCHNLSNHVICYDCLLAENERMKQEIQDLKTEIYNQDCFIGELKDLIPD